LKKLLFTHGCSFTSEPRGDTPRWPTYLAKQLNMDYFNHGIGGYGNHGIFRGTVNWLLENKDRWNEIFIVIQWTACCRWEFFDNKDGTKKQYHSIDIPFEYESRDDATWKQFHLLTDKTWKTHPYRQPQGYLTVTEEYYDRLLLVTWLQNFLKINNIPYLFFDGISSYKYRDADGRWFAFTPEDEIDYNLLNSMISFVDTKRYLELPLLAFCGDEDYVVGEGYFEDTGKHPYPEYKKYKNKWEENMFEEDGFHPNPLGHERWSEFLFDYIKENKLL